MFAVKWEGVQVVAARVLGKWGGRSSVELLRQWLMDYYARKSRNMGVERVACEALLACYEPQDVAWILDLYFNNPKKLYSYMLPLTLPIDLSTGSHSRRKQASRSEPSTRGAGSHDQ